MSQADGSDQLTEEELADLAEEPTESPYSEEDELGVQDPEAVDDSTPEDEEDE